MIELENRYRQLDASNHRLKMETQKIVLQFQNVTKKQQATIKKQTETIKKLKAEVVCIQRICYFFSDNEKKVPKQNITKSNFLFIDSNKCPNDSRKTCTCQRRFKRPFHHRFYVSLLFFFSSQFPYGAQIHIA